MCDGELPMQVGTPGSCELPGRVRWRRTENHNILKVFKAHNGISGLLQPFITTFKEFNFFHHTYIHKSLILAPKLHAPKIDKTCPNCSRII